MILHPSEAKLEQMLTIKSEQKKRGAKKRKHFSMLPMLSIVRMVLTFISHSPRSHTICSVRLDECVLGFQRKRETNDKTSHCVRGCIVVPGGHEKKNTNFSYDEVQKFKVSAKHFSMRWWVCVYVLAKRESLHRLKAFTVVQRQCEKKLTIHSHHISSRKPHNTHTLARANSHRPSTSFRHDNEFYYFVASEQWSCTMATSFSFHALSLTLPFVPVKHWEKWIFRRFIHTLYLDRKRICTEREKIMILRYSFNVCTREKFFFASRVFH